MADSLLPGHLSRLYVHELLAELQVELLQQDNQLGFRVSAVRSCLQVHGGMDRCDVVGGGSGGRGAASGAD